MSSAEPAGGVAVQGAGVPVVEAGERFRVVPGPLDESGVVFGIGRWHRPGSGGRGVKATVASLSPEVLLAVHAGYSPKINSSKCLTELSSERRTVGLQTVDVSPADSLLREPYSFQMYALR